MLFLGALLAFAAEIAAFVAVADQIGILWAILLLILVSAMGPFVVRRVGFGILTHTRERLEQGEVPTRELFDGIVVLIGGVLICIPGFIGDALGLLLMIGPVRHLVIAVSGHRLARRVRTMDTGRWQVVNARSRTKGRAIPDPQGLPPHAGPTDDRDPGPPVADPADPAEPAD